MSVKVDDSECFAADVCLMSRDCPFLVDCKAVEDDDDD